MDSCQYGIAVVAEKGLKALCSLSYILPRQVQSTPLSASSAQHMWELVAGNRTAVLPRHALGGWISFNCRSAVRIYGCAHALGTGQTLGWCSSVSLAFIAEHRKADRTVGVNCFVFSNISSGTA